jgi:shikimate dehydrogenase
LGIVGFPIGHSISPIFHQAALNYCRIEALYSAWEVAPKDLGEFVESIRVSNILGVNVTVPHKETIIPHLDQLDDWAKAAGAVNTVVSKQGTLIGYNTDGYGFLRALKEVAHFEPQGRRVLILGAGGASRAAVLALVREGVGQITVANRTQGRAHWLADLTRGTRVNAQAISMSDEGLSIAVANAELIVNCTTLGMANGCNKEEDFLTWLQIPPIALVYDLVYNPVETPLLRAASRVGARILSGIHMLVYQGAASFEMWTGREAPVKVMLDAAMRAMEPASAEE